MAMSSRRPAPEIRFALPPMPEHGGNPTGIGTMGSMPSLSGLSLNTKPTPKAPAPTDASRGIVDPRYSGGNSQSDWLQGRSGRSAPPSRSSSRSGLTTYSEVPEIPADNPMLLDLMIEDLERDLKQCEEEERKGQNQWERLARLRQALADCKERREIRDSKLSLPPLPPPPLKPSEPPQTPYAPSEAETPGWLKDAESAMFRDDPEPTPYPSDYLAGELRSGPLFISLDGESGNGIYRSRITASELDELDIIYGEGGAPQLTGGPKWGYSYFYPDHWLWVELKGGNPMASGFAEVWAAEIKDRAEAEKWAKEWHARFAGYSGLDDARYQGLFELEDEPQPGPPSPMRSPSPSAPEEPSPGAVPGRVVKSGRYTPGGPIAVGDSEAHAARYTETDWAVLKKRLGLKRLGALDGHERYLSRHFAAHVLHVQDDGEMVHVFAQSVSPMQMMQYQKQARSSR